ncbi:hypothetical protein [Shewanella sp.]|uniref:hypothetical protein n=1 Tax=Shewanella sp. TaxID=50422 RepID=UPI003D1266E0
MTIRAEAKAAKAADPLAVTFTCTKPCFGCGGTKRYVKGNHDCVYCQSSKYSHLRNSEAAIAATAKRDRDSAERLEKAVNYFQTLNVGLCKSASMAGVGTNRLKRELAARGIRKLQTKHARETPVRLYGLGASSNMMQVEFAAAAPSIKAMALFNAAYRKHHQEAA